MVIKLAIGGTIYNQYFIGAQQQCLISMLYFHINCAYYYTVFLISYFTVNLQYFHNHITVFTISRLIIKHQYIILCFFSGPFYKIIVTKYERIYCEPLSFQLSWEHLPPFFMCVIQWMICGNTPNGITVSVN